MFTSIFIPDKDTRELRFNVSQMSKKLKFITLIDFLCFNKAALKNGRKNNPSWPSPYRIEKFTLSSLVPTSNSDPSGEISLSYMGTHGGLLYSCLSGRGSHKFINAENSGIPLANVGDNTK